MRIMRKSTYALIFIVLLVASLIGYTYVQGKPEGNSSNITPSFRGLPHHCTLTCSDPTKTSDEGETITVRFTLNDKTTTLIVTTGKIDHKLVDGKKKANLIANAINEASDNNPDGNGDGVEAVALNGVILLVANDGYALKRPSWTNNTREKKNRIALSYPEISSEDVEYSAVRFSGAIKGTDSDGFASEVSLGWFNTWFTYHPKDWAGFEDWLKDVVSWARDRGYDAYLAHDTLGGTWILIRIMSLGDTGVDVVHNFGGTDEYLDQEALGVPPDGVLPGGAITVGSYHVLIDNF